MNPDEFIELEHLFAEMVLDIDPNINPLAIVNSACVECKYFHGNIYEGILFVCGIHPYGWSDENCPDWEAKIGKLGLK
jgi:hypothetical protein